jgi:methionine-gamma-lyase
MIMRSMETLSLRMHRAADNAEQVAKFLLREDKVTSVNYLGFLEPGDPRHAVFQRQCGSAGSTFAFSVRGGEAEAFRFLDALQVIKLAVSLGGTESLISHPHPPRIPAYRNRPAAALVTDSLVRSRSDRGPDDLIATWTRRWQRSGAPAANCVSLAVPRSTGASPAGGFGDGQIAERDDTRPAACRG